MNTGHEGGCGTLHANAAADVPPRLEALAVVAGLSRSAVHSQLAAALDVVVHLVRERGDGLRRVAEVCVLRRGADDIVRAESAASFPRGEPMVRGAGADRLHHLLARRGEHW